MSQDLDALLKSIGEEIPLDNFDKIREECILLCPMDRFAEWNNEMYREGTVTGFLRLLACEGFITAAGDLRFLRSLLEPLERRSLLRLIDDFRSARGLRQPPAGGVNTPQVPVTNQPSDLIEENSMDDYIRSVSEMLGARWERFARKGLRLKKALIDDIVYQGRRDGSSLSWHAEEAMCRWQEAMGSHATPNALMAALRSANFNLIADTVFR